MILRKYQTECLEAIKNAGPGNWACILATGLGKSVIMTFNIISQRRISSKPCGIL